MNPIGLNDTITPLLDKPYFELYAREAVGVRCSGEVEHS
jgi:hypothetical protein